MANDESLINELYNPRTKRKKEPINFKITLNCIIEVLRKNGGQCSKKELAKKVNINLDSEDFFRQLRGYTKVEYHEASQTFRLKSRFNIKNKDELIQYLKKAEKGIMEDEELKDSYPGIKKDLENLKRDKLIKEITNKDANCSVLFYRDITDEFEKMIMNIEYCKAIDEIRKIWNDNSIDNIPDNNTSLSNKRIREEEPLDSKDFIPVNKKRRNNNNNF